MDFRMILAVMLAASLFVVTAYGEVPHRMSYQGKLTDETGVPVSDGDYTIQFRIYTAPSAGDLLWEEQQTVGVADGLFSVVLGDSTSIPDTVFTGPTRWLALQLSPDPEMSPRKPIVSVGYAFRALDADTADYALSAPASPDNDWVISGDTIYHEPGNVGIGTTSPGNKLHIVGSESVPLLNVEQTGSHRGIRVHTTSACALWIANAGNHGLRVTQAGGDGIHVENAGGHAGYFNGSGYFSGDVGIGTPGPTQRLHVVGNIRMVDGNQAAGYVLTSDANGVGRWQAAAGGDSDWSITGNALHPAADYGLSMRQSNVMHGTHDSTHVNLGIASTTGAGGQDRKGCTVAGGYNNTASDQWTTVAGGRTNTASNNHATVGGGYDNRASGGYAVVGGGWGNTADHTYATVGGGKENTASTNVGATVAGGFANTASGFMGTVGGGENNMASGYGATVGGGRSDTTKAVWAGVSSGYSNLAGDASTDTAAFVGGGYDNSAIAEYATVSGGYSNGSMNYSATVGGGYDNSAYGTYGGAFCGYSNLAGNEPTDTAVFVGGGYDNGATDRYATVCGGRNNWANRDWSTVGGGYGNTCEGNASTVGGGYDNVTGGVYGGAFSGYSNLAGDVSNDTAAFVGGGYDNSATGKFSTVSGGKNNTASYRFATVGGGQSNTASNYYATVGGGSSNDATQNYTTVGGGDNNAATGEYTTVGGGLDNHAQGYCATVAGGRADTAGGNYSFAAGRGVKLTNLADNTFAYGVNFSSSTPNAVIFHNSSNEIKVGIGVTNPANILTVQLGSTTDPIADAWTLHSSRRWKTNIEPISEAVEKVKKLRGVHFDWKKNGEHDIGLIAEEVGEVIPEVVAYEENGQDAKSVDYARLVALLVEAVKELEQKNEALTERVHALENNR